MTAAAVVPAAPARCTAEALRERVQVLESRPGAREVLAVSSRGAPRRRRTARRDRARRRRWRICGDVPDGVPRVQGGLPLSQRQRLANAIGGPVWRCRRRPTGR